MHSIHAGDSTICYSGMGLTAAQSCLIKLECWSGESVVAAAAVVVVDLYIDRAPIH